MEIRQLRYFCAVAARRSFRQAAEDIHIAQPALSQQIRRLEEELGIELFDRGIRPVALTLAGDTLLARARGILADIDHAKSEIRDMQTDVRGKVTLGAMQYLTRLELPDLIATIGEAHPAVELQLRIGNTGQLRTLLLSGEIDVAIIHVDDVDLPEEFAVEPLRIEELVVVVHSDHPLAGRLHIRAQDLMDTPIIAFGVGASIRRAVEEMFGGAGMRPHITIESADLPTAVELAARGLGATVVPRSMVGADDRRVSAISFAPTRMTREVAVVWSRERFQSRALGAVIAQVRRGITPDY